MERTAIGVIGCGNISSIYLQNLNRRFDGVYVAAVADLNPARAGIQAEKYGVPRILSTDDLLADPQIEVVLNLTTPPHHYTLCKAALDAGKHVYVEKPLSVSFAEGRELVSLAERKGLLLGSAPDTFLGAGIQTCLDLIGQGVIGRPVGASAHMTSRGHESWHPDPEFYYQSGGGPMFDMGPYYLTALFALLGGARRLTGSAAMSFPERIISSEPKRGQRIQVEIPTHIAGIIDLASGAVATILTTFDVWYAQLPHLEIYGSEGTLAVPDPNSFGGPVRLRLAGDADWRDVPLTRSYPDNSRGLGVVDLCRAVRAGTRDVRASGEMALHVLEAMHGFHIASAENRHYRMTTEFTSPAPLAAEPAGAAQ